MTLDVGERYYEVGKYLEKEGFLYSFPKFFAEGLVYMFFIPTAFSASGIQDLILVIGFFGLVMLFSAFSLLIGITNVVLGRILWQIKERRSIWSLVIHGYILWALFILTDIPLMIDVFFVGPGLMYPLPENTLLTNNYYAVLIFLAYTLWRGYLGKSVANWFKNPIFHYPRRIYKDSEDSVMEQCPTCKAIYLYPPTSVGPTGNVHCPNCGEIFYLPKKEHTIISKSEENQEYSTLE